VKGERRGKLVVLHLAARYPFAGVLWQLLHHLVGFRRLGLDVYYIEDHGAWVYDPVAQTSVADPTGNLKILAGALERYGFAERWAFLNGESREYIGMSRTHCLELLAEADAVINLCAATNPREEHRRTRCLVYLQTDPGLTQVELARELPAVVDSVRAHKVFFSYAMNIDAPDCRLPAGGVNWHPTRPPVLIDEWLGRTAPAVPALFSTVSTWHNTGNDVEIAGETYYWSKDVNFRKFLEVARRAGQPIELASDLVSGPDYERALAGGFTVVPVVPMSLDPDAYRQYISNSRGEFTASKDVYVRTRSGWFSDRSVCYLAAGRPVVTQRTGFEKYVPEGLGLIGFDDADEAVHAIRTINADYARHARAAREIACEYFDASKLLDEIAEVIGL
jgi:hypothetical protein